MLNTAEGAGRRSGKDKARFFDIARGSAEECARSSTRSRSANSDRSSGPAPGARSCTARCGSMPPRRGNLGGDPGLGPRPARAQARVSDRVEARAALGGRTPADVVHPRPLLPGPPPGALGEVQEHALRRPSRADPPIHSRPSASPSSPPPPPPGAPSPPGTHPVSRERAFACPPLASGRQATASMSPRGPGRAPPPSAPGAHVPGPRHPLPTADPPAHRPRVRPPRPAVCGGAGAGAGAGAGKGTRPRGTDTGAVGRERGPVGRGRRPVWI